MTAPPQEWPTMRTGPFCISTTRWVAVTSSARELRGFWTATAFSPRFVRRGITLAQQEPSAKAPCTSMLVHGAFADGSCWAKVIPLLTKRGLKAVAVQNPLSSLADDVTATHRVVDMQKGPVLMVGHSWGGAVITEAGNHPQVKGLVYIAAGAPDSGQSFDALVETL